MLYFYYFKDVKQSFKTFYILVNIFQMHRHTHTHTHTHTYTHTHNQSKTI